MSESDPGRILRSHGLRSTPQRRAILHAFRGTAEEHLSADEVLSRAARDVPDIGRGTVYSTLAELTELGILASVGDPEPVRYESNVDDHDHFRCRLCLRMFDVQLGGVRLRARAVEGYELELLTVYAEGVCRDCHAFRRGRRDGAEQMLRDPAIAVTTLDELACQRVDSPVGELGLVASEAGVVHVAFSEHAAFDAVVRRARTRRGSASARRRVREVSGSLERYFGGFRGVAPDQLDWRLAAADRQEALVAVQAIAWSESQSYDHLAGGLSAYDCGRLLGANPLPLIVPCHRVTCGSERSDAYVGGISALETLSELEREHDAVA